MLNKERTWHRELIKSSLILDGKNAKITFLEILYTQPGPYKQLKGMNLYNMFQDSLSNTFI